METDSAFLEVSVLNIHACVMYHSSPSLLAMYACPLESSTGYYNHQMPSMHHLIQLKAE